MEDIRHDDVSPREPRAYNTIYRNAIKHYIHIKLSSGQLLMSIQKGNIQMSSCDDGVKIQFMTALAKIGAHLSFPALIMLLDSGL